MRVKKWYRGTEDRSKLWPVIVHDPDVHVAVRCETWYYSMRLRKAVRVGGTQRDYNNGLRYKVQRLRSLEPSADEITEFLNADALKALEAGDV